MKSVTSIMLAVFLLTVKIATSQITNLSGQIADKQGNKLFAVNIYLLNHNSIGTTADLEGNFALSIPSSINLKDEYLMFSFIGFNTLKLRVDSIDGSSPIKVVLAENKQTINEVVVEGRKSISREFSIKEMDKMKIYLSPLSAADPLKALAMLPSSTNTDETANPELRGSSSNRSKVFFNGVPVTNPVRNSQINGIGFFSLFNTELVKDEFIYPSNPPLIYGNTSAGMIDIETEEKLEKNSYQVSLSLASVGVSASQKLKSNSFIQLYVNKMFSDGYLFVNSSQNERLKGFNSSDIGMNYHNELSENVSFNLYNYLVSESSAVKLNLFTWEDIARAKTIRDFTILNLKYHHSNENLSLNAGTNFRKSDYTFGNIKSKSTQQQIYFSLNYKHLFSQKMSLQTGISNDFGSYRFKDVIPEFYYAMSPTAPTISYDTTLTQNMPEGYLYFRWNLIPRIIWGVGLRTNLDLKRKNNPNYVSYQTNIRVNFSKDNSLLLSAGEYHNFSEPNYSQMDFQFLSSRHISAEYLYEKKKTTINLSAYYKLETGETDGSRRIKGFEIFFDQYLSKYFKLSLSNTLLNSEISFQDKTYGADNNVGYFLVSTLSYFDPRYINFSVSWSNRQGKLYTPVNSSTLNPLVNFYQPEYSTSTNSTRFNNYNTINISLSKMFSVRKNNLIAFASIANILNFHNQQGLIYNTNYSQSTYDYYQMRAVYFGCVISFN